MSKEFVVGPQNSYAAVMEDWYDHCDEEPEKQGVFILRNKNGVYGIEKLKQKELTADEKLKAAQASLLRYIWDKDIVYSISNLLGEGSKSFVYAGKLGCKTDHNKLKKDVAVKKISCGNQENVQRVLREVETLLKCTKHDNIVNYLDYYVKTEEVYIFMDLCNGTLQQWFNGEISGLPRSALEDKWILTKLTLGLAHLHEQGIIHGDLKPSNILLVLVGSQDVELKIADFGCSRMLPEDESSMNFTTVPGTKGWRAPEAFPDEIPSTSKGDSRNREPDPIRMTVKADIFALGLIYYWILSEGNHPFGNDSDTREINIKNFKLTMNPNHFSPLHRGYLKLLMEMLAKDPQHRPTTEYILGHFILWPEDKAMQFVHDIKKALRKYSQQNKRNDVKMELEEYYYLLTNERSDVPKNWLSLLVNPAVKTQLEERYCRRGNQQIREYQGDNVTHFYNAIRNLEEHYDDLKKNVREALGSQTKVLSFFLNTFPNLILILWETSKKWLQVPDDCYHVNKYFERENSTAL